MRVIEDKVQRSSVQEGSPVQASSQFSDTEFDTLAKELILREEALGTGEVSSFVQRRGQRKRGSRGKRGGGRRDGQI